MELLPGSIVVGYDHPRTKALLAGTDCTAFLECFERYRRIVDVARFLN
jgi:hypothetical protein